MDTKNLFFDSRIRRRCVLLSVLQDELHKVTECLNFLINNFLMQIIFLGATGESGVQVTVHRDKFLK